MARDSEHHHDDLPNEIVEEVPLMHEGPTQIEIRVRFHIVLLISFPINHLFYFILFCENLNLQFFKKNWKCNIFFQFEMEIFKWV